LIIFFYDSCFVLSSAFLMLFLDILFVTPRRSTEEFAYPNQ